jgi:hypothetical protein
MNKVINRKSMLLTMLILMCSMQIHAQSQDPEKNLKAIIILPMIRQPIFR